MYIKRDEFLTFNAQDYIYNSMYSYDSKRIEKWWIDPLVDYYFQEVDDSEYVDVDVFTDWIHELTDADVAQIVKTSKW